MRAKFEDMAKSERAWRHVAEFLHGRLQIDSRKTGRKVDPIGAYYGRALGSVEKETSLSSGIAKVLRDQGLEGEVADWEEIDK